MKKILVLVVDRDDDFGVKGNVDSPVIGRTACLEAVAHLGVADPEDSDINALYAALNIYEDLYFKNADVEVALICGDQKVGYRSDSAIIDELEEVLEKVEPDRLFLVGDGAEDEYVYPIISSRIPIDSVKKVYVKQAPGIEGTVYILSKILEDPGKRKRFLSPIGWILALISMIYLIPGLVTIIGGESSVSVATTPAVVLAIGLFIVLYAHNVEDKFAKWKNKWANNIKGGSISVSFIFISAAVIIAGLIYGLYSYDSIYTYRTGQIIIWYIYSVMWFFIFGIMIYSIGDLLDSCIKSNGIKLSRLTFCMSIAGLGLIATGAVDIIMIYFEIGIATPGTYTLEFILGVLLTFFAALIQHHIKQTFDIYVEGSEENAV